MDTSFGDVAGALGVAPEAAQRTIADLDSVIRELSPRHLSGVLWQHARGFRTLLAPADASGAEIVGLGHYAAAVGILSRSAEVVVLHLPRALDDLARSAMEMADRIAMVLTLDVLAFRHARRALDVLSRTGLEDRCDIVVNRVGRSELLPADVQRVFGRTPLAVIPSDRAVSRAQDRGRLVSPRSRTGRTVSRLAERLLGEAS
jgi:Flp pilus assembly CpaE family ATPase